MDWIASILTLISVFLIGGTRFPRTGWCVGLLAQVAWTALAVQQRLVGMVLFEIVYTGLCLQALWRLRRR